MTWLAQVRHVLVKDIRKEWRPLLVYVALVAIAVGRAFGWEPLQAEVIGGTMLVIALVGVILAASAVQSDSPSRSDAFWASHPLHRSAMVGAKVGFALLLLGIAAIGQAAAVYAYDLRGPDLIAQIAAPTWIYCGVLLTALLVSALTADLRSFLLAVVAIPLALLVVLGIVAPHEPLTLLPSGVFAVAEVLLALTGLGVLTWLYRTRDIRRRTRVVAFAVAALTLLMISASPSRTSPVELGDTMPHPDLTLELPSGLRTTGSRLDLVVRVPPLAPDVRFQLESPVAEIRLRDGRTLRVSTGSTFATRDVMNDPTTPRVPSLRWSGIAPGRESRLQVPLQLTPEQRRDVATGVASIALEARVVATEAEVVASMPLAEGAEVTRAGQRIRIRQWSRDFGEVSLTIHSSRIPRRSQDSNAERWYGLRTTHYALVNAGGTEGIILTQEGTSGEMDGLVLPGTTLWAETSRHGTRFVGRSTEPPFADAWYANARLLVVSNAPRGRYPVRLVVAIPQTTRSRE